jgi:hypothetical protein
MQPNCVYCGSNDNLNTQLTISLENGSKVTVDICDEHSEEASVKTARAAYMKKQEQIEAFLEQAKALGIEIQVPQSESGIVVAQQAPQSPAPAPAQPPAQPEAKSETQQPIVPIVDDKEAAEGWVPTAKVDQAKGMRSVGGSTEFGGVSGHNSYQVSGQEDVLDEKVRKGKVKMTLAEGRAGAPLAVPQKRIDGTGTTHIRIVKKETDHTLQRRFKDMAQDSKADQQPDFRQGYGDSTRTCPICHGDCVVGDQDCPKCEGLGVISVY